MDKVRCGVIGTGWWGTTAHIPALKRHPGAEIVAVHSRHPELAKKIAGDFSIPRGFSTVEELLSVEELDAVVICSTANVHHEQAKAALERGLHALIEKPMTMTVREAMDLVELADEEKLHFLISCPWHYTSHGAEARRLIQSGEIGQLKMISTMMTNFSLGFYQGKSHKEIFSDSPNLQNTAEVYLEPERTTGSDPSVAGGGHSYCQVSHVAAYIGFLTGVEPVEVFARFDNAGLPIDVYDTLNILLEDGTQVTVATHGAPMMSERNYEVRIFGTEGMVFMELWKGKMEYHDANGNVRRYPDIPEEDIYPMYAPTENLVDVVLGRAPNRSPASLGTYAMKIIEASCESARTKQNVIVTR